MAAEAARGTGRFGLAPVGPYSISASARFLEGFAPAHYEGGGSEHLRFAFVADGLGGGERVAGAPSPPRRRDRAKGNAWEGVTAMWASCSAAVTGHPARG